MKDLRVTTKMTEVYHVRTGSRGHRRYSKFFNRRAALKNLAWRVALERYWDIFFEDPFRKKAPMADDAKRPRACDCEEDYWDDYSPGFWSPEGCPLHDRNNGYYRRLHAKIMRWLDKGYILPNSGLVLEEDCDCTNKAEACAACKALSPPLEETF